MIALRRVSEHEDSGILGRHRSQSTVTFAKKAKSYRSERTIIRTKPRNPKRDEVVLMMRTDIGPTGVTV
jgi:hypothetical protein